MGKSKCTITTTGYRELIEETERLGLDTPKLITEAIELSGKHATTRYRSVMSQHHVSGLTEDSIVENPKAENDGNKITMNTGFNIRKGGAPAIWLDRGTPKQKPTNFIRKIKKDKVVTGAIGYVLGNAWRSGRK